MTVYYPQSDPSRATTDTDDVTAIGLWTAVLGGVLVGLAIARALGSGELTLRMLDRRVQAWDDAAPNGEEIERRDERNEPGYAKALAAWNAESNEGDEEQGATTPRDTRN